jgi:dephospho-CoA kinase
MAKKIIIGLTGPIASGKNTVAKMFARRGAFVIDADTIGHKAIAPQSKAWHEIVKAFGSKVLNRGGAVNRRKLARIVFSKPSLLKKLDKISHPEMRKMISGRLKLAKMSGKKHIVVNAALLEEIKLFSMVDKVILVLAGRGLRLKRLLRSGMSRQEALARIRTQRSDQSYRKTADFVIDNNRTIDDLKKKVVKVISKL